ESNGKGGPRRPIRHGDPIGPAAAFHPADADRLPVAQSVELAAEQFEIANTVEFGIVRHAGRAVAKAELGAQVKLNLRAAIDGPAAECATGAPLVDREWPFDLAPRGGRGLSGHGRPLTSRDGAGDESYCDDAGAPRERDGRK